MEFTEEVVEQKESLEFTEEVVEEADRYNGFNLILADLCSRTMVYVTNRPNVVKYRVQYVTHRNDFTVDLGLQEPGYLPLLTLFA
ncbi:hypothetical protein C1H46_025254 [Malus baccata]|uniref:Uncharacterized protein n=1 Tax=Malus baccata TaxID=106549 RepID=A0A540LSB7_MALBA|nr:hypothetical protein C1H46_025254 [Malus baccata]